MTPPSNKPDIVSAKAMLACCPAQGRSARSYTGPLIAGPLTAGPLTAGVDEAGRGPLAGNVVAAAVILDSGRPIDGLMDSKQLREPDREALELEIRRKALAWSVAAASVAEIDKLNILHASMLAMQRAVALLPVRPQHVQVDGNRCPDIEESCEAIIKGDQLIEAISAASILAKVARDRMMYALHERHPGYGFDRHKGYPTRVHIVALAELGALPEHRRSFAPVRRVLEQGVSS